MRGLSITTLFLWTFLNSMSLLALPKDELEGVWLVKGKTSQGKAYRGEVKVQFLGTERGMKKYSLKGQLVYLKGKKTLLQLSTPAYRKGDELLFRMVLKREGKWLGKSRGMVQKLSGMKELDKYGQGGLEKYRREGGLDKYGPRKSGKNELPKYRREGGLDKYRLSPKPSQGTVTKVVILGSYRWNPLTKELRGKWVVKHTSLSGKEVWTRKKQSTVSSRLQASVKITPNTVWVNRMPSIGVPRPKKKQVSLQVTFMVRNSSSQPVKLTFYSGQSHDILLLDKNGVELYRWSAGRFFTQQIWTKTLQPGEIWTIQETLSLEVGEGTPFRAGTYQVKAYLTLRGKTVVGKNFWHVKYAF